MIAQKVLCAMQNVMAQNADAFIALPGGYGTLEEVMEMITWQQLGIHSKPVGFLNVNGLYTKLLSFFDDIVAAVRLRMPHASQWCQMAHDLIACLKFCEEHFLRVVL